MTEYVMDYDGWAEGMPIGAYFKVRDAMHERKRERIVRCRDCACFSVDDSDHDYRTGWWCKRWYTDMVKPDGFCAWGEKREDDSDGTD